MALDEPGIGALTPEDVTNHGLPLAMRGYDKDRLDRHLARVASAYALSLRQCSAQRDRLRALEDELDAAIGEASASARAVAELMQRTPPTKAQQPQQRKALDELETRLKRSERERDQALADLKLMSTRASDLGARVDALEAAEQARPQPQPPAETVRAQEPDDDAARLLIAATRAAEDVRDAARGRALRTLLKAREMSARVDAQTERERAELTKLQQRRAEADRKAAEILAVAQAEADRVAVANAEKRDRVREILAETLASLDTESAPRSDDLVTDLESRVNEQTESNVT